MHENSEATLPIGRRETVRRINRAMDYIHEHLAEPANIDKLAAQANFSRYHFVRVFAQVTGETPALHLRRIRLERAADLLNFWPTASILDIALATGFHSAAAFARAFRAHFGMSASAWRRNDFWRFCGLFACWRPQPCKECEDYGEIFGARAQTDAGVRPSWPPERPSGLGEIKKEIVPPRRVAYMRGIGPLEQNMQIYRRFYRWLTARALAGPDSVLFAQMLDNPHVAAPRQYRYDVGIVVDETFVPDRYVNIRTVPGGSYVVARFTGRPVEITQVFRYLWSRWIPSQGYVPRGPMHYSCLNLRENTKPQEIGLNTVTRFTCYLPILDTKAPRDVAA